MRLRSEGEGRERAEGGGSRERWVVAAVSPHNSKILHFKMPKRHPNVHLRKVDEDQVSWAAFIRAFGFRDLRSPCAGTLCCVLEQLAQNKLLLASESNVSCLHRFEF